MRSMNQLGNDLYTGKTSFPFVGKRRTWFIIAAILVIGAALVPLFRPIQFSIEFTGGSQFAFIGTLGSGGAAALAAASLLGVRNAVYGAQLNAVFSPKAVLRPLMAHLSIDESFATAMAACGRAAHLPLNSCQIR